MKKNVWTNKLFYGDISVWIIFMFLACCSLVEVFSATSTIAYKNSNVWVPIARHASFLFAGFLLILGLSHTHYKYFSLAILLLPVAILMLLATPFLGVSTNDAYRWLSLFGIQFQPSEFGKLACVVYVAFLLSKRKRFSDESIYKYILWGVVPVCVLIFLFNLSTAVLLGSVCFLMMFIGRIPFKKLGSLALSVCVFGLVFVLALYIIPQETVKRYVPRATTWQNRVKRYLEHQETNGKTYDASSDDYQITHAKIAIARGGIFGQMPGRSLQRDFLPQAYSDFIYAIIIEELGVFGGMIVLLLYVMLMIRVGVIAWKCEKLFPKYLVLGCGLLIVAQALFHMAVNVGLFPVTGQPLPLISRGGTSTVLTCIYIGIILSVSHYGANMGETEEEEVEESEELEELEMETAADSEKNPIFAVESIASEE
ncbi:MAG: FtsW/RodA/SpoVE family cell cycle protein [Tannerella sp.]|jgi:cell division protein FtsW|nr:FtsW/RodA/SpoVE family cell cycle protein [Tannerella sp.]